MGSEMCIRDSDIAKVMVKKSDNTIDDRLVDVLEKALFPGR